MDSLLGKNKDRLYIALYDLRGVFGGGTSYNRGDIHHQKGEYQWALLIAPKTEVSDTRAERWLMRQIPNDGSSSQTRWKVESDKVRLGPHDSIIVRIMIAKVTDRSRLAGILKVSEISSTATEEPRTHKTWIQDMVTTFRMDRKCCKHLAEWQRIEQICLEYAEKAGPTDTHLIPTLDMISGSSGESGSRQPVQVRP